jgi:hypothetical protein
MTARGEQLQLIEQPIEAVTVDACDRCGAPMMATEHPRMFRCPSWHARFVSLRELDEMEAAARARAKRTPATRQPNADEINW